MGGVCAGGTGTRNLEHRANAKGFSGKLKTIKSFGKQKEVSFSDADATYNSGELKFPFSSELKQSRPARTAATKVCCFCKLSRLLIIFFFFGWGRD